MQLSLFDFFLKRRPPDVLERQVLRPPAPTGLEELWREIRSTWFPERKDLDEYSVIWSSRPQKRTLASCNIKRRVVIVARELAYDSLSQWWEPLLYHEMCHAYLGMSVYSEHERSRWHGSEFRALERRHPKIAEFDAWVRQGGWSRAVRSDRARRARARMLQRISAV